MINHAEQQSILLDSTEGESETLVLTQPAPSVEEEKDEVTLRPQSLDDFIGQKKLKKNLEILIKAARGRNEPMDHLLFHGPPGVGKTSLAHVIANELGVSIRITSGPALQRAGDLASILTNLGHGEILFVDEIHKLNRTIEEIFYPAMEDFALDLVLGKGPSAKTMRLDLPHFTLIGATTRVGKISSPLRDRFGAQFHLDFYEEDEIEEIVKRTALIMTTTIDVEGAKEVARRSRRTPRIANRLFKRIRDYAQVHGNGQIDQKTAADALLLLDIDQYGLDSIDRQIINAIVNQFNGGPVGLSTLAAALGEPIDTIEDVYEPFLIRQGFLERTPRGRKTTLIAQEYIRNLEKS